MDVASIIVGVVVAVIKSAILIFHNAIFRKFTQGDTNVPSITTAMAPYILDSP